MRKEANKNAPNRPCICQYAVNRVPQRLQSGHAHRCTRRLSQFDDLLRTNCNPKHESLLTHSRWGIVVTGLKAWGLLWYPSEQPPLSGRGVFLMHVGMTDIDCGDLASQMLGVGIIWQLDGDRRTSSRPRRSDGSQRAVRSYRRGSRNPRPPEPLAFWRRYSA